jgi:hypothetical protein
LLEIDIVLQILLDGRNRVGETAAFRVRDPDGEWATAASVEAAMVRRWRDSD